MSGIKITDLPAVPSAQLTDVFPVDQGATTYKETNSQLLSLFQANGSALTKTDDTNVTLTLGGSPTTALVNAASLTLGWTGQLGLTRGGSNASLAASNGGIIYSTASAMAVLSGTATARQMLQSGASTTPSWSTTTWPATTTINRILYSSSANVIGEITTANSSVLVTDSGGIPSLSSTLPSGIAATNMTLTTPSLGVATATSINFGGSALNTYSATQTWTPTFTCVTPGDLSVSYATQSGYYTRIGNVVNYYATLTCTPTFTTASGTIRIGGLPFTVNASLNICIGMAMPNGGITYTAPITGNPISSQTFIQLYAGPVSPANLQMTAVTTGVALTVYLSGHYIV
jgi:hypothetical protein